MTDDNTLIPLLGFELPGEFPYRIGFAEEGTAVPRFVGYYFQGTLPVAIAGDRIATASLHGPVTLIPSMLARFSFGEHCIVSRDPYAPPPYMLVHDRRDGQCCLWTFAHGRAFVGAVTPITP